MLTKYQISVIQLVADMRKKVHVNSLTSKPIREDREYVGLVGEVVAAQTLLLPINFENKVNGDGGIDFKIGDMTIDVKTYAKPNNLLVAVGHLRANVYVLAYFSGSSGFGEDTTLLGWETREALSQTDPKDFGYGLDYHILKENLRPISELMEKIYEIRQKETYWKEEKNVKLRLQSS